MFPLQVPEHVLGAVRPVLLLQVLQEDGGGCGGRRRRAGRQPASNSSFAASQASRGTPSPRYLPPPPRLGLYSWLPAATTENRTCWLLGATLLPGARSRGRASSGDWLKGFAVPARRCRPPRPLAPRAPGSARPLDPAAKDAFALPEPVAAAAEHWCAWLGRGREPTSGTASLAGASHQLWGSSSDPSCSSGSYRIGTTGGRARTPLPRFAHRGRSPAAVVGSPRKNRVEGAVFFSHRACTSFSLAQCRGNT